MWQLESEKENEEKSTTVHYALPDGELLVGRKACDILISKDPSVSRKHAFIRTSHSMCNVGNLNFKSVCLLKDDGSKYGTFVNDKQVQDEGVILKHNDLITFGQCGSNYRVTFKPIVVSSSCMSAAEKTELKETIRKLGGHVIDEWKTECTHLAMTKIKITVKTVCALASQKPIVTVNYFKMLLESYTTKIRPVDPEKFLPELDELALDEQAVSLTVNPARSQLFKNKSFIFLTPHQYKKLLLPITLASGKPILINKSRCTVTEELLLSSCVIQYPLENVNNQTQSQTCSAEEIKNIELLLQRNKKRFVPESDVGLAVVHCSVQQYCNPDYEFGSQQSTGILGGLQSQTLSQGYVYVAETLESTNQSFNSTMSTSSRIIEIPPTFRSSSETSISSKVLEEDLAGSSKKKLGSTKVTEIPPTFRSSAETSISSKVLEDELPGSSKKKSSSTKDTEIPATFQTSRNNSISTSINTVASIAETSKKRSATDEANDNPALKVLKIENKSQDLFQNELNLDLDCDTQPTPVKSGEADNKTTDVPLKRPFINVGETLPKSDCNSETETQIRKKIKVETLSPPASPETLQFSDTNYNANTQPASENIFKEEMHQAKVPKETILNAEPAKHIGENSFSKVNGTDSNKNNNLSATATKMHNSAEENKENLDELPSNLLVVKLADLVIQRRTNNHVQRDTCPFQKNFKKFRKTVNCGADALPRIIGENDLIAHTSKDNLNEIGEILQHQESEQTQGRNTSFKAQFAKIPHRPR